MSVRTPRRRTALLIFLVLLTAVFLCVSAIRAASLWRALVQIQSDAASLLRAARGGGAHLSALAEVRAVRRDLEAIDRELRWARRMLDPLARTMAKHTWSPWISSGGILLGEGLSSATGLSSTAWWTALSVESAIENHGQINTASGVPVRLEADPIESALLAIKKQRERLLEVRESMVRVSVALSALERDPNPAQSLTQYASLVPFAIDALLMASEVLTKELDRTYLLLVQNSDELRATGGFISSVATLKMRGHRLVSVEYQNSYDIESHGAAHPPPLPPMRKYMGASMLLFRDANWSPDFPTSAEVVASLYRLNRGQEVDGVIAIDTEFVRLALASLGPLDVPGHDVTVTADNVVETAIAFWERPVGAPSLGQRGPDFEIWLEHRKDFGDALGQAALSRLGGLSIEDLLPLTQMIREAIRQKHLLVWELRDPRLQEALRRMRVDGGLAESAGDYLMVVDSNVGWNKVDRNIERAVDYRVTMLPDGLEARLCLAYRNRSDREIDECDHRARYEDSYQALTEQCYWSYVRVLVPSGSELVASHGSDRPIDIALEKGKMSFGALIVVPPREDLELCLDYLLPPDPLTSDGQESGSYRLIVQKQPGARPGEIGITVDLGDERVVASPELVSEPRPLHVVSWTGLLDSDLSYTLPWHSGQ